MTPNRDFYTGLMATAFFAFVLFVLIPIYVKVPSFIPGFAPPPDMWPRVITGVGLAMGILAIIFAIPKMRLASGKRVTTIGQTLNRNRKLIARFVAVLIGFAAFTYGMPDRFCSCNHFASGLPVPDDRQLQPENLDDRIVHYLSDPALSCFHRSHPYAFPRRPSVFGLYRRFRDPDLI